MIKHKLLYCISFTAIYIVVAFSGTAVLAQVATPPLQAVPFEKKGAYVSKPVTYQNLSYAIIKGEGNTFGYNILEAGKILIHQPSIPGLQGNKGFAKRADAEKVAKLVMQKVKSNTMPPSVSTEELKSLKILNH